MRTGACALTVAIALLATGGGGVVAAVAANSDPDHAGVASGPDAVQLDLGRLRLVQSSDADGMCLFNNSVLAEGVGNDAPGSDRAFLTFRAELLREFGDQVAGLSPVYEGGEFKGGEGLIGAIVNAVAGSTVATTAVSELSAVGSPEFAVALKTLDAAGVRIEVVPSAIKGYASACPVQALIASGELWKRAGLPADLTATSVTNPETGQLEISVPAEFMQQLRETLASSGDGVVVKELIGSIGF